jgi:dethiobiotin synthetase
VQAGELQHSDSHTVQQLVSTPNTKFHAPAFNLETPMSPHAAAKIDGVSLSLKKIQRPKTQNNLVIEGAGGLLVPLNDTQTITDLIHPLDKVIVVSRHYLGSINHTLLTIEALKSRGIPIFGIIFNGEKHPSTEIIIAKMSDVSILGRIDQEPYFDQNVVKQYAQDFKSKL